MKIEVTSSQMTDKACKTSEGLNCQIQKGLLRIYKNSLFSLSFANKFYFSLLTKANKQQQQTGD